MGRTISPRLRGKITLLIGKTGRWQSRRSGHLIRIERCYTPEGPRVSWRVCSDRRWYGDEESTVFAAVEECNRFLAAGPGCRAPKKPAVIAHAKGENACQNTQS
jgi:hypothetical protein